MTQSKRATTVAAPGRVDRNSERLIEAAADVVLERGWDDLTYASVADRAGLTTRTLYDRYANKSELGIALWNAGAGGRFLSALAAFVDAIVIPAGSKPHSTAHLTELLSPLSHPTPTTSVAMDLLGAATFDLVIRDHIVTQFNHAVGSRCVKSRSVPISDAARTAFAVNAGVGLFFASRRPGAASLDLSDPVEETAVALTQPAAPAPLPTINTRHMKVNSVRTGDPALDALLTATLDVVSELGYHAATTSRIVTQAGVSEGLLYGRYATKLDLFLDATSRGSDGNLELNARLMREVAESHTFGIAEATFYREHLRPEHARGRALVIERIRLAWNEPRMRANDQAAELAYFAERASEIPTEKLSAARSSVHWGLSMGYGTYVTAFLLPRAWKLPFDVVTTPLRANA